MEPGYTGSCSLSHSINKKPTQMFIKLHNSIKGSLEFKKQGLKNGLQSNELIWKGPAEVKPGWSSQGLLAPRHITSKQMCPRHWGSQTCWELVRVWRPVPQPWPQNCLHSNSYSTAALEVNTFVSHILQIRKWGHYGSILSFKRIMLIIIIVNICWVFTQYQSLY